LTKQTEHEQQTLLLLQKHQETIYNGVDTLLKSNPELVHSINPDNGYNLLHAVLSNPSLANYIPLLQLLISTSEFIVEKGSNHDDSPGLDTTANSSDSEDTVCVSTTGSKNTDTTTTTESRSSPVSTKSSYGWFQRGGTKSITASSVPSPRSNNSIKMIQLSSESIPSQARVLRDRTFTTGGNCLHIVCENINNIDRTTIKYLLQSYPASVCCYDYATNDLPIHAACTSTYQHYCGNHTKSTVTQTPIVDLLMLLVFQYPDSCKIPNQDGNLPLHLAVSSMYKRKKSITTGMCNNSINGSSHHAKISSMLYNDVTCAPAVAEGHENGTDDDNAASFGEELGDDDDVDTFNRRDVDIEQISMDTVDVRNDTIPAVITVQKEQMNACSSPGRTKNNNDNKSTNISSTSLQKGSEHDLVASNSTIDNTCDGLIEVIEYLIDIYPDALNIKNNRGYTPHELARIEYVNDQNRSHGKEQVLHYLRHAIVVTERINKLTEENKKCTHGKSSKKISNVKTATLSSTNNNMNNDNKIIESSIEFMNNISLSSTSSNPLDRSINNRWTKTTKIKKNKNNTTVDTSIDDSYTCSGVNDSRNTSIDTATSSTINKLKKSTVKQTAAVQEPKSVDTTLHDNIHNSSIVGSRSSEEERCDNNDYLIL
jgi:hypothetical protein